MSSSGFSSPLPNPDDEISPPHSPTATGTSTAKPDFSVITQTIGRQIHNVASFLAPPSQRPYSPKTHTDDSADLSPSSTSSSYQGMKNDLAEISDSFKTGLSLLSPKKAVTKISRIASNLLQIDKEDVDLEVVDAVGITDAVLDFVTEISNRPQCWIDFPLSLKHKEFSMSRVQKGHVLAILQLIPNLTTLRHKIQDYMSEEQFWMIYFILLLPRLNEHDFRKLSTPEIIQVREELLEKLRNNKKTATGSSEHSQVNSSKEIENPLQDIKSSSETGNAGNRIKDENHPEYVVSFSDVEDEDNDDVSGRLSGIKQTESSSHSSASETSEWVHLSETAKANRSSSYRERHSESEESSGWHAVEDVDL